MRVTLPHTGLTGGVSNSMDLVAKLADPPIISIRTALKKVSTLQCSCPEFLQNHESIPSVSVKPAPESASATDSVSFPESSPEHVPAPKFNYRPISVPEFAPESEPSLETTKASVLHFTVQYLLSVWTKQYFCILNVHKRAQNFAV